MFSFEFCKIFKNTCFYKTPFGGCFCIIIIIMFLKQEHFEN